MMNFMTSLCFLLLECRLSIHSDFHSPDMCFFTQIVCYYLLLHNYTRMLIVCSLYVFEPFPDSSTDSFEPFSFVREYVFLYMI